MSLGRIAIVGIGGVFPGADALDGFWRLIAEGGCAARQVPPGRWRLPEGEAHAADSPRPDKVASIRGCFVDHEALPAASGAEDLDPLFRIALAAARRAWSDARGAERSRERTGVIIGNIVLPTDHSSGLSEQVYARALEEALFGRAGDSAAPGRVRDQMAAALPAGLIARELGLGGGTYTLDAACASSLYALKLAADELLSGRADAMLTGGLSRPACLYTQMGFSQLKALAPDGRCAPFDVDGRGLVVGEGAGFFIIKRLEDAIADGDRIAATIAGIGLSNDTAGSLLAPDSDGQLRAMEAAYRAAGWRPGSVDLIECHATGTPLGDAVEVESLRRLWAEEDWRPGQCVIGSVKSNVGHLLTAAGAAGLAKVLLGFRARSLPPTANTRSPAPKLRLDDSPFRVLSRSEDWPEPADRPRRAAVSAFGFGGINAHVLLEEWRGEAGVAAEPKRSPEGSCALAQDLAIVGRAARVGPWQSSAAVERRLLGLDKTEPRRWSAPARIGGAGPLAPRGFFVEALGVPLGRFRIPPKEFASLLPQQLLMLLTAAEALEDAGWQDAWGGRAGTFVGIGLDMETGAFQLRWTLLERARRWNVERGLGLSESELLAWVAELREALSPALDAERTLGALGGIVASRLAREFRIGGPSFTLSAEESSGLKALEAAAHCLRSGAIDRALVGAVDLPGDLRAAAAEIEGRPFAELVGEGAAAFVVRRLDDAIAEGETIHAIIRGDTSLTGAASSLAATRLGRCGAAEGLLELFAATALLRRSLRSPRRPWLCDREDGPRRLKVSVASGDGNRDALVIEEAPQPRAPVIEGAWAMSEAESLPFVFAGADPAALRDQLRALSDDADLPALARSLWTRRGDGPARLALAARDSAGLRAAIEHADQLLAGPASSDAFGERQRGVYFRKEPLLIGRPEALAFVFPGSGNHAPGMGRSLALAFPELLARQELENALMRSQFHPELLWDEEDPAVLDERLEDLILGQVAFGTLSADALALLGVRPGAVLGYSLGESAALFGMRVWSERDEMYRRVRASSLFSDDMGGELRAVRAAWGLAQDAPAPRWSVGIVDRSAAQVTTVLGRMPRVYLLIVNTPRECVIGGEPEKVAAAVEALGARFFPLPGITAVHCEVAAPVAGPYRELHRLTTEAPKDIRFYSGSWCRSYQLDRESAADSILNQALAGVDFPATVDQAYEDGARVFIEVGPGASCARMIGEILRGRPFAARSVADPHRPEAESLLQAALALYAEGYPVDFDPLLARLSPAVEARPTRSIEVRRWRAPASAPRPPTRPAEVSPRPAPSPVTAPVAPAALAELGGEFARLIAETEATASAQLQAHSHFLALSGKVMSAMAEGIQMQMALAGAAPSSLALAELSPGPVSPASPPVFMDRDACMEFAIGRVGRALGPAFAEADAFPTRVRLPDEPLMLVDRIVEVEAEPKSMSSGRLVTEHDVLAGGWYLDGGRIPTCIAVEAGQADLFLSGYLGIDFETRGEAVYRLLDAKVTFHQGLPKPGAVIRYDIAIDEFFRQGDTILFRFRFESTVDGAPLLSMREGCAGFFTAAELAAGKGVVRTRLQLRPRPGVAPEGGAAYVAMTPARYDAAAIEALRRGELAACFGPAFAGLPLRQPRTIPGAEPGSLMRLLDRVTDLEPEGGRFGLGLIRAELAIQPDDWFLVCHFSDDQVMPGTLMYECCLHTLRVFLLRLGWVGEESDFICEPKPGVTSQLKCRGQVIAGTAVAMFEIEVKELGFEPDAYAIADALMYADGRPIVEITDMSLRLTGLGRDRLDAIWGEPAEAAPLFGPEQILAYAVGKPSEGFGEPYRVFDEERILARLPGPPYLFLDRILAIEGCEPWVLEAGGSVVGEYDVPADAWYFADNGGREMPFAVLLEVALQPCGWFAAYLGSALTSPTDLSFRNLGGSARQLREVGPDIGSLTTRVTMTRVSSSGGMIIQNYDLEVRAGGELVYAGDTYFGFFSKEALADQVGVRDAEPYRLTEAEEARARRFSMPRGAGHCGDMLTMMDRVEAYVPDGGPSGLGFIRGFKRIDPEEWFFSAHFYQDPVWPGSLGLEAFLQLLRVVAEDRWGARLAGPAPGSTHRWVYRGQVLPADREVRVEAQVTAVDEAARTLTASGLLIVDGRIIYEMKDFVVALEER